MREDSKVEYTVRSCNCDDIEELEEILNQMSNEGWELYSLNEVENEEGEFQYLCIFNREIDAAQQFEDDYIVDSGDFKTRMKKLLHKKDDLYEECRFLQKEIREKSQRIKEIKQSLDSTPEEASREDLNKNLSDRINEFNLVKSKFSEILSPSNMYNRISQDLLTVVVSYEHSDLIDNEIDGDLIAESVRLRQKLTDNIGYVLPRVHFVISEEMNENEYKIKVRNLNTISGIAYPKHRRFFPGQSNIYNTPENAIEDIDPVTGQSVFWLKEEDTKGFWESGMTPSQVIASHLEMISLKYVNDLLNYEDVLNYVSLLEEKKAFLADDLIHSGISIGDLRYIFAGLIRERVSVKDIQFIFEKLNDLSRFDYDKDQLLKELRVLLGKEICSKIADSSNIINVITIPERYKKYIKTIIMENKEKNKILINEKTEEFIKYVSESLSNNNYETNSTILIAEPDHRKVLFEMFEQIIPYLTVLSEEEIPDEFTIQEI